MADRPALQVAGVSVRFGGITALDGVTLALARSEVVGVIGPNGAGKTTLFDVISGFVTPSSGTIWLGVDNVTDAPAEARAAAGLGRSFQDARLFPSLTVKENIKVAFQRSIHHAGVVAAVGGITAQRNEEAAVGNRAEELIALLGLGAFRDKFASELSTGSRRVVDLAMALAHAPAVLLLDEPSSGIAQRETEALGPLILRIRERLGCAVLVIEHDMPLITSVSDRIVALETGRVIAVGSPDEVMHDPGVESSYLGGGATVADATTSAARRAILGQVPALPAAGRRRFRGPSWTYRAGLVAAALLVGGSIYLSRNVGVEVPGAALARPPVSSPSPSPAPGALPSPIAPPLQIPPYIAPVPSPSHEPQSQTPGPTPRPTAAPTPGASPSPSPDPVARICSVVPAPICPTPR